MGVLQGTLLQIGGTAHIMVRSNDETGSFAAQKLPERLDLCGRGLLFGEQVIQAEDHQRVGIAQDALVQRQSLTGLIDPLKDCDRRAGDSSDHLLESHDGQMEQLQRSRDTLQKHLLRKFHRFISRPRYPANLSHRRESIVQLGRIPVGFPRIAPGPIDAETPFARRCTFGRCADGYRTGLGRLADSSSDSFPAAAMRRNPSNAAYL